MATFNKFNCFAGDIGLAKHNLNTDTLKVMLTNTAPVATNAVLSDITEISTGNGYSAGGLTLATTSYAQTSGVGKLGVTADPSFTASGTVGPFRYWVLYNNTSATKPLIGWVDRGSSITISSGDIAGPDFDQTSGILTVQ